MFGGYFFFLGSGLGGSYFGNFLLVMMLGLGGYLVSLNLFVFFIFYFRIFIIVVVEVVL